MPIPSPVKGEKDFTSRCMSDPIMIKEYPDKKQRAAVCYSKEEEHKEANNQTKTQNLTTNQSFIGKRITIKQTNYAVYPVVLMVEGVHHAVNGDAVYYPLETLRTSIFHWEGRPIPVMHPNVNGSYVRANDPEIEADWVVGRIYNARIEDNKLKGDAYIDVNKAERIAPGLLMSMDSGSQMEVSTGVLITGDGLSGTWNNESYAQTITNMIPDHLALLPGAKGACSWEDGCGIRVNVEKNLELAKEKLTSTGIFIINKDNGGRPDMDTERLDSAIKALNSSEKPEKKSKLLENIALEFLNLQREPITLLDDIVEANEQLESIPVVTQTQGDVKMSVKEPCCPEKVNSLITNENTAYTDADLELLNGMESADLDKLFNSIQTITDNATAAALEITALKATIAANAAVVVEPVKVVLADTVEALVANATPAVAALIASGMAQLEIKKTGMVTAITANTRNKFTVDQLNSMDIAQLEMIAAIAAPVDFSVTGTPAVKIAANTATIETPYVCEVKLFETK